MRAIASCLLVCAAVVAGVGRAAVPKPVPLASVDRGSLAYLLRLTASARPEGADPAFDCAWRKYAMEYVMEVQPFAGEGMQRELFDALQLARLCGAAFAPAMPAPVPSAAGSVDVEVFVSASAGSDSNPGTEERPVKSVGAAVRVMRAGRAGRAGLTAAISLRAGTYFLNDTIVLGHQDSLTTIQAYEDGVVVSGGRSLTVEWKADPSTPQLYTTTVDPASVPAGITALQIGDARVTRARYPNANPELDLFPKGYVTAKTAWTPPVYRGETCDPRHQCGQSVNLTIPVTDAWHGMYQNYTQGYGGACEVYDPPRSPWCSGDFYLERQFPEMHTRHPSGMELSGLPKPVANAPGMVVHAWRPGHWYTWMFEVASQSGAENVSSWEVLPNENNINGLSPAPGQNGTNCVYLGSFKSQTECWAKCNATKLTGGAPCNQWTWHGPTFDPSWRYGCYARLDNSFSPTAQHGIISGVGPHSTGPKVTFGRGGNQGGEGNDGAGEWFVENAAELLDAPNEFFYDNKTGTLSLIHNGTGAPPANIVVPTLVNMLELRGTLAYPVQNITVSGIVFRANRPSFLEPRGNPSGGDWALERMGAVFLEGTEDILLENNTFTRLDSNAVFLSGYNRRAAIKRNTFRWLGQNAIASWGRPLENDGTNGDQPRYTLIKDNWVSEIGHIQKQSSFYFQAETALTTIETNVCFNIPRAAINFNDGFGGGNVITRNLLFNTCRESSDHGAFNSWDRLPYITAVRDGSTPSSVPALNLVHRNFIVANYAADGGCLDNDDGSSYYHIYNNLCAYGGHKSDFDGNSKASFGNLHVYPSVYGVTCLNIGAQVLPPRGYAENYTANRCILGDAGAHYLRIDGGVKGADCLSGTPAAHQAFVDGLALGSNTIHVPGGAPTIKCGKETVTFQQFQKQPIGLDATSTVNATVPSAAEIIAWAKELLQ